MVDSIEHYILHALLHSSDWKLMFELQAQLLLQILTIIKMLMSMNDVIRGYVWVYHCQS